MPTSIIQRAPRFDDTRPAGRRRARSLRMLAVLTCGLGFLAEDSAAAAEIQIVVSKTSQGDVGLRLATEDLAHALGGAKVVHRGPEEVIPQGDLILVGRPDTLHIDNAPKIAVEAFRIAPVSVPGREAILVEGDRRGLMYGVFKLAERIRVGEDPWSISLRSAPAFPLRFFSEEGQLLDIPDLAYYSDEPPYVDQRRLRKEIDEAKRLVDHVVRHGFNTLVVLHLSFEEYIDYRYLEKPVYQPGDRHLVRSPVFCKFLKELCDYAHARHVDVYLQLYELQFPPQLDALYGVGLDSPNIQKIIRAKTRELFDRVPLDGLYITATEAHPRCGYRSRQIWRPHGRKGAARMITMFHDACRAVGKRAVFRLWRIASDAAGAKEVTGSIPNDALLSIKNTGGDFYFSSPTTNVITGGVGKQQPFVVIFDAFRQFDGWSRLFCFMKRWGAAVRECHSGGVVGINAWGPWSEGCIWPDWEPGYLRDGQGRPQSQKVSWAGYWNSFRMFTRGFTPGQANVYLLSRLAWDPDCEVEAIARDFAALHVGAANARAAARALMATQDAFCEEYVPGTHPCYLKWTMTFHPRGEMMERAYQSFPLEKLLASNVRALAAVRRMEQAFDETEPGKAPDARQYAQFKEGIEKTALYLRTFYLWREAWWRHRAEGDLESKAKAANRQALTACKARLAALFDQWKRFPEEAGYWRVTFRYGRPRKGSSTDGTFTYWYPRGDATMESTVKSF